jgi:hypothetical protein
VVVDRGWDKPNYVKPEIDGLCVTPFVIARRDEGKKNRIGIMGRSRGEL